MRAVGPRRVGGVDPATRTFQALRIAVNGELEELEALLAVLPRIVQPGGVAAIISFHSLEDRSVKRAFHDRDAVGAADEEARDRERTRSWRENPRSRSAKLRAARRAIRRRPRRLQLTAQELEPEQRSSIRVSEATSNEDAAGRFSSSWTLAVAAATCAFIVHLALRVRSVELGYELGRAHAHLGRLREVKRVLELELSSHKTPERVDLVARTLLGMSEPSPDRILSAGPRPVGRRAERRPAAADEAPVAAREGDARREPPRERRAAA